VRNLSERTNYLYLNKIQDRWWWYATTMCSLPTVFLKPRCLSRSQINSSRNKKIQETGKIQSLWECLIITNILSFSWMFTKSSIFFCVKTCAVQSKQTEEVSPVTETIRHKNDLSENQEYLKKQQQMKGKTISYLKNICEPHFFQTTC